jgi:hypothetical protein
MVNVSIVWWWLQYSRCDPKWLKTQSRVADDLPCAMRFGCAAAFHTQGVQKRSTQEHRDATPKATSLQREGMFCQYPFSPRVSRQVEMSLPHYPNEAYIRSLNLECA